MRSTALMFALVGLVAAPLGAQGQGDRSGGQGIPPGHMPPPGECRVWYDGRPPGQQPPPTSCREAERVASRDRYARVIYGGDRDRRNDGWSRDDDRRDRDRPRAVPRRDGYPGESRYPYPDRYPDRGGYGEASVPFDNGYKDGFDKGREDAEDRDAYDPVRHGRYRSGDRGYDRRYGSKDAYKNVYREGFRVGYEDGYRGRNSDGRDRRRNGIGFRGRSDAAAAAGRALWL